MLENNGKIQREKKATLFAMVLAFVLILSVIAALPSVNAQMPTRKTTAYLSVNPHLLGVGQTMTVNLWIYPSPASLTYSWWHLGHENVTITFTRPDGSKDTFLPVDGSGGLKPGQTEMLGAIWFLYTPNMVGNWNVQFTAPAQVFGDPPNDQVLYDACTSQSVTFSVQSTPVQIILPAVPLPSGYWSRPVNSDNREWSKIAGDWLPPDTKFNQYSTAPNSPHILWKRSVSTGGIVGGDWGSLSYGVNYGSTGGAGGAPSVIINGKLFCNNLGGVFDCIDLRTGNLVYEKAGSISRGQHLRASTRDLARGTPEAETVPPTPYLWELGSSQWKMYDPDTGALLATIANVPVSVRGVGTGTGTTTFWNEGDPIVYVILQSNWNSTIRNRFAINDLIKWNYSKVTSSNWTTGIEWRTTLKQADGTGPGEGNRGSSLTIIGNLGIVTTTGENTVYARDLTNGKQLWTRTVDYQAMSMIDTPEGLIILWDSVPMVLHAYDGATMKELWTSQVGTYPWGSQFSSKGQAYGNLYTGAYDGYLRAIDQTTGKQVWNYYLGNTTETPQGTLAPYMASVIADGKIYVGTSEHSPTQPRFRGQQLVCVDAITGKGIWNISGALGALAISDGYLVTSNENDGLMYCFGKGKTATTIQAPTVAISKGNNVLLQGTIMDQSPAQPATPCVAEADQQVWMEYLHMQKPASGIAPTVKGVSVHLTATDPNGNYQDIGTVTSDAKGNYFYQWTPPVPGMYLVTATFTGSESYWESSAETAFIVSPTTSVAPVATSTPVQTNIPTLMPTQTAAPTPSPVVIPPTSASPTTTYIAIGSVIVIIIAAAATLVLRKRKK